MHPNASKFWCNEPNIQLCLLTLEWYQGDTTMFNYFTKIELIFCVCSANLDRQEIVNCYISATIAKNDTMFSIKWYNMRFPTFTSNGYIPSIYKYRNNLFNTHFLEKPAPITLCISHLPETLCDVLFQTIPSVEIYSTEIILSLLVCLFNAWLLPLPWIFQHRGLRHWAAAYFVPCILILWLFTVIQTICSPLFVDQHEISSSCE